MTNELKKFPDNFIFSTSTNSFQIEGGRKKLGRTPSLWDKFTNDNFSIPSMGSNEREINSIEVASDFFSNYKIDAKIMKNLGTNGFVYNLDWARIISKEGEINKKGLQWTINVFKELNDNGIKPIPIIFHWDTPLWLEKQGGATSKKFIESFRFFSKVLFENLGKYTDTWYVNDENSTFVEQGYFDTYFPPGVKDKKKGFKALHVLNVSAAVCMEEFRKAKIKGFIVKNAILGIDHDWSPGIPYDENDEDDLKATKIFNEYNLNMYLDPNIKGKYNSVFFEEIKKYNLEEFILDSELDLLKNNTLDFIGWNYYRPTFIADLKRMSENIEWHHKGETYFDKVLVCYKKDAKYTEWNWLIDSTMLVSGSQKLQDEYNKPLMIVENGIGYFDKMEKSGVVNDTYRINYLNEHLLRVQEAISKGINFIGYSLWTYCDIFSPSAGYRKKYGLVNVDFEGQTLKREPKSSYYWYKNVIKNKRTFENTIPYDKFYNEAVKNKNVYPFK